MRILGLWSCSSGAGGKICPHPRIWSREGLGYKRDRRSAEGLSEGACNILGASRRARIVKYSMSKSQESYLLPIEPKGHTKQMSLEGWSFQRVCGGWFLLGLGLFHAFSFSLSHCFLSCATQSEASSEFPSPWQQGLSYTNKL